jgi:UPF0755 protein
MMRKIFLCAMILCLFAGCGAGRTAAPEITQFIPAAAQPTSPPQAQAQEATATAAQPTSPPQAQATSPPQAQAQAQAAVTVVIPEGFSFYQVARRLEANGVCSAQAFYNAAQTYQAQSLATPHNPNACFALEGYLYPDTYQFYQGDAPVAVLRKFLNNYKEKSGLPDYDTLIMASIIERETRSSEHMAMVSSVYHNRLANGMPLQADATRAYTKNHIKKADWLKNTEQYDAIYDTYQCKGLPAGPICNPSRRAIQAAQSPSRSQYLYYFFGNDNTNHYSPNYEEHKAAMAKYGVNYG